MFATEERAARKTTEILLVDDHPIVRRGVAQLISDQPDFHVAGEAEDPVEALRLFEALQPDLTIVDLTLRQGSGINLIKQIKARNPHAKILVLSMHAEFLFAEHALRVGALGYVNKQEATEKLIDAIRQVLSGRIYASEPIADRLLHHAANRSASNHRDAELSIGDTLSDRELEVLRLIGQGQTTRQIANNLHLSPKTVETHRENLKKKLNLKNATELTCRAVVWVLEEGR